MTKNKTQRDTFEHGIGVLAAGNTTSEIQANDPIQVHGVALPVNTVVQGGQGDRYFFPPGVLEDAADLLEGANIVKNFHELEGQAPADDVIGEVTNAAFSEGVGLVYEGELLDEDIAQRVAQGYLDVSPTVARALGQFDEARDARAVEEVVAFRDLAVVQEGQPGAEIEVGANPAVAALQRDVLSRAFNATSDVETDVLRVSEPEFNGYDPSELSDPTLSGTYNGDMESARNAATWIDGDGETFDDLSLFVLNGDAELNLDLLDSAWRLAPQTDGPTEDDVARLRSMYEGMAEAANEAGALSDDEFDNVWQDRVVDEDTMSLDEAKQTLAEEYGVAVDDLDAHLDSLGGDGDDDGSGADPELADDEVILVESEAD